MILAGYLAGKNRWDHTTSRTTRRSLPLERPEQSAKAAASLAKFLWSHRVWVHGKLLRIYLSPLCYVKGN
jgi:hypothetical protein